MPKIVEDQQVYQAVIQIIIERGYAGATTRQMAEAAGVSEVTLFRKYGNKLELVRQAVKAIAQATNFAAAVRYTGDLQEDLLRVVQSYQDAAVRNGPFFAVIFTELPRYPELVESLDTPLSIFQSIDRLVERYQAEGRLKQEDSRQAVAALLGPLMYAGMMRFAMPGERPPSPDLREHVKLFLEGRAVE